MSYIPVRLQRLDPETETWSDVRTLHALQVNSVSGRESFNAGSEQYHLQLKFRFAWSSAIEPIRFDPHSWQLVYNGHAFNIVHYDDYMESHIHVDITGEAYGG